MNGTVYVYKVAAVNAAGPGAKSNGVTAAPATVPSPPLLTATTPGNGSVTVTWNPANANGSPITNYRVYRAAGTGSVVTPGPATLLTTLGNVTTFTDSSVTNGMVYDYRITAVNGLGDGLGSNIGTAVPTPVSYGAASWWSGLCDANSWNPKAAQQGWLGEGAHPLGASYLGVAVCGPRPGTDAAPAIAWNRPGLPVMNEWDSNEYAFRFMSQVYGVTPYAAAPKDVVRNYAAGAGGALQFVANGTAGTAPEAGDVISFDNANGVGLVGVVGWAGLDANGNGEIRLVAQNDAGAGWRRLSVVNWSVLAFNGNTAVRLAPRPAGPRHGRRRPDTDPRRALGSGQPDGGRPAPHDAEPAEHDTPAASALSAARALVRCGGRIPPGCPEAKDQTLRHRAWMGSALRPRSSRAEESLRGVLPCRALAAAALRAERTWGCSR